MACRKIRGASAESAAIIPLVSFPKDRRVSKFALGALLVAAWAGLRPPGEIFVPYVPGSPPQLAVADFDADGSPDLAVIHDGRNGSDVSITLSGLPDTVELKVSARSVAASDIDHDGDVDLVATTSLNEIVVWLNDGRGHFTEEHRSTLPHVSPLANLVDAGRTEPAAVSTAETKLAEPTSTHSPVVVASVHQPTVLWPVRPSSVSPPSLRAPPPAVALS